MSSFQAFQWRKTKLPPRHGNIVELLKRHEDEIRTSGVTVFSDSAEPTALSDCNWNTLPAKTIALASPKQRQCDQRKAPSQRFVPQELVVTRQYDLGEFKPARIFGAGDRILVQGGAGWKILGIDGLAVAEQKGVVAGILFDGIARRFISLDLSGTLRFHALADGRTSHTIQLGAGAYGSVQMGRCGGRLILFGHRTGPEGKGATILESISMSEPVPRPGSEPSLRLALEAPDPAVSVTGHSVYVASRGRIAALRPDLQLYDCIQGDFVPVALTVDPDGWIYLITDGFDERLLSLVTPQAESTMQYRILPPANRGSVPPLVGAGRQAYVIGGNRIVCIDQTGKLQWIRGTEGDPSGAVVSGDTLIVPDGKELAAFDGDGQRSVLCRFSGDSLAAAPPVFMEDGCGLVCGTRHMYRLGAPRC
jgi:hypothetical protein